MCDAFGGLDSPAPWTEAIRRARKPHPCDVCAETIRPGERYHFSSGCWDGNWNAYRHCLRCWRMFEIVNRRAEGEADLLLDCGEVWDDPPDEVAALAFLTANEIQALAGGEGGTIQ